MRQENLTQMKTGEVAKRARKAGVDNVDRMNKQEMIAAIGRNESGRSGGGGHAPRPPGTSPQQWKNVPGNQS
ncbi:Rho termination factor N-terminal domain-containing protein [Micromonospora inositola]|uniref:Rho termination factor, N-terminal domain n=1 Tax=Micromonospora inositola TaxID=47865 RepID=A0A1C5JI51_9ACTN|nr:Rho termination factor N-terminal domain-containing protein [Micromonospora inositola]SCG70274.1 Rho termination factor, N-terminal domain [Micromonospora inositola]